MKFLINLRIFVPRKVMRKIIIKIVSRLWGLMMKTAETWENISNDVNKKNTSLKIYFLPLVLLSCLFLFFFKSIYASQRPFETGFIYSVVNFISLVGTYYITYKICYFYFTKNKKEFGTKINIDTFISYSFSIIFVTKIVVTIIPSLFFLQILNIYTAYIVWEGAKIIFKLNEEEQGKVMIFTSLSIIFTPIIISRILHIMLPAF
jgi:hypothetical protein